MKRNPIEALVSLDPGGIRLARGVHWVIVVAASGFVCLFAADHFGAPDPTQFAIMGGATALNAFIFSAPGTRRSEAFEFLKNFGIAFGVFALAVAVGWGGLGYGDVPAELAWVVVIAIGLYLRRYGPAASQYGMMATLSFMFMTLANPTRDAALWLLPAVAIACVTTFVVHNLIWRPSAIAAYRRQVGHFLSVVAAELAVCRDASIKIPPHSARQAWEELARASQLAAAEKPRERQRLQAMNAMGLRLLMALRVVKDETNVSDADPPGATGRRDFDRLFGDTRDVLIGTARQAASLSDECEAALRQTRDNLIGDQTLSRRDKFHWVRQVIGLLRVITSAKTLREAQNDIGKPWQAVETPASPALAKDRYGVGWRLALQGAVAAGITVAIGLAFGLSHAYWATMTVFLVLSANLGATIKRTIERAVGTSIGVLIAVGLQPLIGDNLIAQTVLVALVAIPIFALIERHYMITAGLIGFLVVMAVHVVEGVGVDGMVARLYQTAIGASLALLAAWLVFPIRAVDHVRPLVQRLFDDGRKALSSVAVGDTVSPVSLIQLNSDSAAVAAELVGYNSERLLMRHRDLSISRLQAHVDALVGYLALLISTLHTLKDVDVPDKVRVLEAELVERLSATLGRDLEGDQKIAGVDDLIELWQAAVPLDGSVPAHEAILMVEELYYARKVVQILSGLDVALERLRV